MYGAILGDIISFRRKVEENALGYFIDRKTQFTDRTVAMIALADALTSADSEATEHLDQKIAQSLARWGRAHFDANYSAHFKKWLAQKKLSPLNDFDDGAAARATIIPHLYNDRDRICEISKLSAVVTHEDIDNFNNSQLAAVAVYCAMRSSGKNGTRISFEYELGAAMSEAKSWGNVVVEAMEAFLSSADVWSAIQNALARDGDTSTRAIIAGGIAEVFYGVSASEKEMCNRSLSESMLDVLDRFDKMSRRSFLQIDFGDEGLTDTLIENALRQFHKNADKENFAHLMNELYYGMRDGGNLRIPLVVPDRNQIYGGGGLPEGTEYLTYQAPDGKKFVAAFTGDSKELAEKYPDVFLGNIRSVFTEMSADELEESGIVLNPDDKDLMFVFDKDDLKAILNYQPPENKMFFFDGNIEELAAEAWVTSNAEDFESCSFASDDDIAAAYFITKIPKLDGRYIIHSPLMFCDDAVENVILNCYRFCLDLAKKYHVTSVAFPIQLSFVGGLPLMNAAINAWFKANEDYGLTVIVASGDNIVDSGNERNFFAVHFTDDATSGVAVPDEKNLSFDYSKGKPVSTGKAARQKARDFKKTFDDSEDFYKQLKAWGFKWRGDNTDNEKINDMWALNALARAIDAGFDPFNQR